MNLVGKSIPGTTKTRYSDVLDPARRTCQVGLERATGEPYESIIYLLEEATR
jgi:hypothetical protein